MKIAGQKNDGAWFRFNKFLKAVGDDGRAALQFQLEADPDIMNGFSVIEALATVAGYSELPDSLLSVEAWTTNMVDVGITRQTWQGKLTWDTYTKTADEPPKYVADHTHDWAKCGQAVRRICRKFRAARREMLDLANEVTATEGNPGGIADATKD